MDGGASPLAVWLDGDAARVLDPVVLRRLRESGGRVARLPHGTIVCFPSARSGPRLCAFDAGGTLLSALRWHARGGLEEGWVRAPDRTWLVIEPRAGGEGPWGESDRLWWTPGIRSGDHWREAATPLSLFAALDWSRIARIPPLGEPARLPPGAGTAVLNLIAELAGDAGTTTVPYDGPYPTEALFLALLESFRYRGCEGADPLAAFMDGRLTWAPDPHERRFTGDVCVHLRRRIEKVVAAGRTYYRVDWQGIARWSPRRIREGSEGVLCSLWTLGIPVEDHLLLANDGAVIAHLPVAATATAVAAIRPHVMRGVAALVAVRSAAPLAAPIRRCAAEWELEWGPVDRDLIALDAPRARLSWRLLHTLAARLAGAGTAEEGLGQALAALAEIAELLGDSLRRAAQDTLARAGGAEQEAALATEEGGGAGSAADIARAVDALLVAARSLRGVDDHPDVEGDERGDRRR